MAVPEAFGHNDWTPPPHVAAATADREAGRAALAGMGTIACSAQEAAEARALTCGMIALIDEAVGQVRSALAAHGRPAETVVSFTSDHGDHLGDHRLLLKGAEQYEQLTRVPFLWADPAGPSGMRTGAIGQTHDIGPTILERARVEPAHGMQGRPLAFAEADGRDAAFIQYDSQRVAPGLGVRPRVHTIRDGRWRLSLFDGVAWGELYDLADDPGEFDNLWDDPGAARAKARLLERLARAEIEHVDRVPMPTARA
jgi:arylsulfatase A-like enzyme